MYQKIGLLPLVEDMKPFDDVMCRREQTPSSTAIDSRIDLYVNSDTKKDDLEYGAKIPTCYSCNYEALLVLTRSRRRILCSATAVTASIHHHELTQLG